MLPHRTPRRVGFGLCMYVCDCVSPCVGTYLHEHRRRIVKHRTRMAFMLVCVRFFCVRMSVFGCMSIQE
jgi:hypothetical protein